MKRQTLSASDTISLVGSVRGRTFISFSNTHFHFLVLVRIVCCAALQLHPDKNKHPKAEIAFKLVSEVRLILSISSILRKFTC